jgi:hypothetical protein
MLEAMNTHASPTSSFSLPKWVRSVILVAASLATATSRADDWMTWASTYTHDPQGRRVDQYALPEQPIAQQRSDFTRSGFRSYRSSIQVGQSADNFHVVEQWGRAVQPYEQWRFPFRPYGVPYDAWGPQAPYGIFNGNLGGGFPGYGYPNLGVGNAAIPYGPQGNFPQGNFGGPRGFPLQPTYQNQPWFDGTYPDAPPLDNRSDAEFHRDPTR